jgi:large subunit ribosomal protein L17
MVTIARKGTLAARRLASSRLQQPKAVKKLFDTVVPAMEGRKGGYTRILKLGTRKGDGAPTCLLQWVVLPEPKKEAAAAETAAEAPAAESK